MQQPPTPRAAGGGDHPGTAGNFEWSLQKANVIDAWALFASGRPGAGVTIGHPDTGFTPHPDLADPERLLVAEGFDFDDDDPNPIDDLDDEFLDNPGHGTGTGSVIVSNRGPAPGLPPPAFVSGAAPFASLIPIRTTESVVLFSTRGLRRAIDHAVSKRAHVISISLGGPLPSPALKAAIRRAIDAGAIVLAAAGNQVGVVVFPAAFDETIAVAASTFDDEEWAGSSRGDAVDISAPGASVWRARVERGSDGGFDFSVNRGNGTSFAVATTAGVAALWVSFHGFKNLVSRYGAAPIARVFKSLLQSTCRTPPGWDTANFGPGHCRRTSAARCAASRCSAGQKASGSAESRDRDGCHRPRDVRAPDARRTACASRARPRRHTPCKRSTAPACAAGCWRRAGVPASHAAAGRKSGPAGRPADCATSNRHPRRWNGTAIWRSVNTASCVGVRAQIAAFRAK